MHARKLLLVVLLLVSVTACGGGDPVAVPLPPEPVTAPEPAPADPVSVEAGYVDYWSPSTVAALEAAKATYVAPPKRSTETSTTTTTQTATSPVPAPAPAPAPTPTEAPKETEEPKESAKAPAPKEPAPTRPEATEPAAVWVEVVSCEPDIRIGWTRVEYHLFFEGTKGWTIHAEDNDRPHDPADSGLSKLITATDDDPDATVLTAPEETSWIFRAETASLASRFAVPYHEDVLLRSPEGVVTSVPVIGLLVPRSHCGV